MLMRIEMKRWKATSENRTEIIFSEMILDFFSSRSLSFGSNKKFHLRNIGKIIYRKGNKAEKHRISEIFSVHVEEREQEKCIKKNFFKSSSGRIETLFEVVPKPLSCLCPAVISPQKPKLIWGETCECRTDGKYEVRREPITPKSEG